MPHVTARTIPQSTADLENVVERLEDIDEAYISEGRLDTLVAQIEALVKESEANEAAAEDEDEDEDDEDEDEG